MILYCIIVAASVWIACQVKYIDKVQGKGDRLRSRQWVVNRICLTGIFALLFGVSVLRIRTGNDYQTYIDHFHDIVCGNFVVTEKGFNLIVTAIYRFLDGEYYLVIFGVFAFFTILIFLAGLYRQSVDFKMSFFLFMTLGLYFQTFNTVRYYLALAIVVYAMYDLLHQHYMKFVLWIVLASLFHKSVLVVLVLFFVAKCTWKWWHYLILGMLGITGLVAKNGYMKLLLWLYPSYVNEEEYLLGTGISYVNIARCLAVIVLCLLYYKYSLKNSRECRFFFQLNVGALILYSCFFFVPFVSRIGYYLNVSQLFLIPMILKDMPKKHRKWWTIIIVLAGVGYFILFLQRAAEINIRILPYTTWLFE